MWVLHINAHWLWTAGKSHLTRRPGGHLRMVLAAVRPCWMLSRPPEEILRLLVLALQLHTLQADKRSCNIIGCSSGWYSWVCRGWGLIESRRWLCVYSICWLILLSLHWYLLAFSNARLFVTLWAGAHQAPLSTGLSGQGCWLEWAAISSSRCTVLC